MEDELLLVVHWVVGSFESELLLETRSRGLFDVSSEILVVNVVETALHVWLNYLGSSLSVKLDSGLRTFCKFRLHLFTFTSIFV